MNEIELSFEIWVMITIAAVMKENCRTTADLIYYPVIERRAKRDKKTNALLTSLFSLSITPIEAARFIYRCYPETIELIKSSNQNITV